MEEKVLILDFGGQYDQLIARRVRECAVYCEVMPWQTPLKEIEAFRPAAIIFTGGPPGNTARRKRPFPRTAPCSGACRKKASPG